MPSERAQKAKHRFEAHMHGAADAPALQRAALLNVLIRKGLITEEEVLEEAADLMAQAWQAYQGPNFDPEEHPLTRTKPP